MTEKTCTKCKKTYPATAEYFTRTKSTRDGLHTRCKPCRQASNRAWWAENKNEISERRKDNYPNVRESNIARHKKWRTENRDKYRAGKKKWYEENRDYDIAKSKEWKANNRERSNEYSREYYRKNKGRVKATKLKSYRKSQERMASRPYLLRRYRQKKVIHEQARRARKEKSPINFTEFDWKYALDYFDNCCAVCSRPLNGLFHTAAMDHWIPICSDNCPGTIPKNIVPLCHGSGGCNNSKCANDPIEWLVSKYGPYKARQISSKINDYFESLK